MYKERPIMLPCFQTAMFKHPHRSHLWPYKVSAWSQQWYCPGLRKMKFKSVEQIERYLEEGGADGRHRR